jgi:hypothetical protein
MIKASEERMSRPESQAFAKRLRNSVLGVKPAELFDFKVIVQYRFKSKKGGVQVYRTIKGVKDAGAALDQAWRLEIKPYPSRVLNAISLEDD